MDNNYGLIVFWLAFPLLLAFQARIGTMVLMFLMGVGISVWVVTSDPAHESSVEDTIETLAVQPPVDPLPLPSHGEPDVVMPAAPAEAPASAE